MIVPVAGRGWNRALEEGLRGTNVPLVLVTTAIEPWTAAHLDPLLKSIDACDHDRPAPVEFAPTSHALVQSTFFRN